MCTILIFFNPIKLTFVTECYMRFNIYCGCIKETSKIISEHDREIPQSQTAEKTIAL